MTMNFINMSGLAQQIVFVFLALDDATSGKK